MRLGLQTGSVLGTPHVFLAPEYANYPGISGLGGFGDASTQQIASLANVGAQTTIATLVALGTIGGPVGAAIGAAVAGLTQVALMIAKEFEGCGQTCIIASQDANKYGALFLQNLRAYIAAPVHYRSLQAAALNNFDTLWAALYAACSDPALGDAGRRCIGDRERSACKWKARAGGWVKNAAGGYDWTDWGEAGSGDTCWNYFVGMRDPIANDPAVVPDPAPVYGSGTGSDPLSGLLSGSGDGGSFIPLLIGGGLLAFALAA